MKKLGNTMDELEQNCPSEGLIAQFKNYLSFQQEYDSSFNLESATFTEEFGGYVYLIETVNDLKEIPTVRLSQDKLSYLSLHDTSSEFDICEYVDENYLQVLLCTNNGGGNTYLIPKEIVESSENVKNSILLTNNDMQSLNEDPNDYRGMGWVGDDGRP